MTKHDPNDWLGNTSRCEGALAPVLVNRIATTFGSATPDAGAALPPLWHWAFFQVAVTADKLGDDGLPARGNFLPPVDDRNRMWTGGQLTFQHPLRVGVPAVRESELTGIRNKQGRNGSLLFATVRHNDWQAGQNAISFRVLRPLMAPTPFNACGRVDAPGRASLWADNDSDPAHEAELTFS